jgi:cell wall-associated NlpC family hydrolase
MIAMLLGACSHTRISERTPAIPETVPASVDFSNKTLVRQQLYAQFNQWRAVKYKNGGLSRNGVDCSGFVYLTFDARFGIHLPRSTSQQVRMGQPIQRRALTSGDLVFFKTGGSTRHVGIYLEDGKFLHASTERGVTISDLHDAYWAKTYWKAIRIGA